MRTFKQYLQENRVNLEYHDTLNQDLFDSDKLRPEVRSKLLEIVSKFVQFNKIKPDIISDVVMSGGSANYNYTPLSDIDVHMIIDKDKIKGDQDFITNYFMAYKDLWTKNHPDIRVKGLPVELYAMVEGEKTPESQGVYSLQKDAWVVKPQRVRVDYDDPVLVSKVTHYENLIDTLTDSDEPDMSKLNALKNKLHKMRSEGIASGGEFSQGNLVFKSLRNTGHIDKMSAFYKKHEDDELSLK